MLESHVTHPLLKSSFIDDGKPIRQRVHFLDIKWDTWLVGQSQTSSHLTNKVRNKETNEYMHGRNIRSGLDLNQGRLDEKPIT